MGQLQENNTEVTQEILNRILGSILGTIGPGLDNNTNIKRHHEGSSSSGSRGSSEGSMEPPFKNELVPKKVYFIWCSQTLNTKQKACMFVIVSTTYLPGQIDHS